MTGRARAIGGNVILASLLTALSYLPFELIAKSTLIVCIAMFVVDPFPTSRLVSVCDLWRARGMFHFRLKETKGIEYDSNVGVQSTMNNSMFDY
eukprot:CCRYP_015912-RA/>CCRYP_015912-RA protein AED:0.46 eAED:0.63 QI:99/0/0.5/1/0/0/2/0/93